MLHSFGHCENDTVRYCTLKQLFIVCAKIEHNFKFSTHIACKYSSNSFFYILINITLHQANLNPAVKYKVTEFCPSYKEIAYLYK